MADIELKPCPFCGDNQQLKYVELSNGLHYIECARCGAAPHRLGAWNRETAVKYWNYVSRWISVEDALPELDTMVIVCYYGSDCIFPMQGETVTEAVARQNKVPTVTMGFLDEEGWNGADMFPMMVQPTFWMNLPDAPLPEPPEKE